MLQQGVGTWGKGTAGLGPVQEGKALGGKDNGTTLKVLQSPPREEGSEGCQALELRGVPRKRTGREGKGGAGEGSEGFA